MDLKKIQLKNFGPLDDASIILGDLTVIVGPQASGKSIFLEMLKYVVDKNSIIKRLREYNYIIGNKPDEKILDYYLGEGMSGAFRRNDSKIVVNYSERDILNIGKDKSGDSEKVFYIPAQRILSISDGRPKGFMEFDVSTPYVLRSFSDSIRVFMQNRISDPVNIYPSENRIETPIRQSFDNSIFHGGKVVMEESAGQRKMKMQIGSSKIPFMSWSAGQKEFMPLLLGFYCINGSYYNGSSGKGYKYVIIEEPEMGLHPQAIQSVLLEVLKLLNAGLRIIISTHSQTILDFVWAFNLLKEIKEKDRRMHALLDIFGQDSLNSLSLGDKIFEKNARTFYFYRQNTGGVVSKDISVLDPGDDDDDISEWGGLSQFPSRVSDIIGRI